MCRPWGEAVKSSLGVPLDRAHRTDIERGLERARAGLGERSLSEYTFANLYLFREVHSYRYHPGEYPRVSGITYDGKRHLFPLFDPSDVNARALLEMLSEYDCYFPIHKDKVGAFDESVFGYHATADDADYVYPVRNFLELDGGEMRQKRADLRSLLAGVRVESRRFVPDAAGDALYVLRQWMADKNIAPGGADEMPCREALEFAGDLGFEGVVYYASGNPVGFIFAECLAPGVYAIRFAKGVLACRGIYPYMFRHCCTALPGAKFFNFEQDLGIGNLRRTKRSYRPEMLLDKFRVFFR